ncbi:MAG: hypothetical protein JXB46_06150, partial [Candidatus Eisenbacteria bacterium]|nr:hypothetical protein [Candidatus Eisenbacteria bacterium]
AMPVLPDVEGVLASAWHSCDGVTLVVVNTTDADVCTRVSLNLAALDCADVSRFSVREVFNDGSEQLLLACEVSELAVSVRRHDGLVLQIRPEPRALDTAM